MNIYWDGTIDGSGKLQLDKPQEFNAYKFSLAGKRIQLVLEEYKDKRSLNQNSFFHACCQLIAKDTGQDMHTIKEYVKDLYGVKVYFNGKWLLKSTARYKKEEMIALIEGLIQFAVELNIKIPDPHE